MSAITLETLNTQILALRAEVAALSAMPKPKAAAKPRAKKAAAGGPEDAEDKPKKETTWWIKATQHVREALKPTMQAHNDALEAGAKKMPGTAPVQVSRILKEAGLLSADRMPETAEIMTAWQTFLTAPLATKTAEWNAAKSSASSASSASGGSKPKAAKAPLTEDEATAARAAKAAKAKATREANKAAKLAAEAAAAAPVAAPEPAAEEGVVEAYEWTHDIGIGKGLKTYERIDYMGKAYVYTAGGDAYMGVWDEATKKLDKKIPDFQAE